MPSRSVRRAWESDELHIPQSVQNSPSSIRNQRVIPDSGVKVEGPFNGFDHLYWAVSFCRRSVAGNVAVLCERPRTLNQIFC